MGTYRVRLKAGALALAISLCAGMSPAVLAQQAEVQQAEQLLKAGKPAEAFALLDPSDRLSLLYCRGRSCRQGRARALLGAVEAAAAANGVQRLRTEASQFSRPLLERQGWLVEAAEEVCLAGVAFERWRMTKSLAPPVPWPFPDNGGVLPGGDG